MKAIISRLRTSSPASGSRDITGMFSSPLRVGRRPLADAGAAVVEVFPIALPDRELEGPGLVQGVVADRLAAVLAQQDGVASITPTEMTMPIPATMRYVDHGNGGGPEVLSLATREVPELGAGEVLIEVVAAGVNRPDCIQRSGRYPPPADASPPSGPWPASAVLPTG
jgi:hypothetical protein